MTVEVAVLGSLPLIVLMVSVDVKNIEPEHELGSQNQQTKDAKDGTYTQQGPESPTVTLT